MDKIIYSFRYETNVYELDINRKRIEILFKNSNQTYVYINRISMEETIYIDSPSLERLFNGSYLTSDGLMITLYKDNYIVELEFLDDNSKLISYGDSKISLINNGFLSFYDDDRDLYLRPNNYRKRTFTGFFSDGYEFQNYKFIQLHNGASIEYTTGINSIDFFEEVFSGELLGNNNKYRILTDRDNNILVPLYNNININNLDSVFT